MSRYTVNSFAAITTTVLCLIIISFAIFTFKVHGNEVCALEEKLKAAGLIDVRSIDKSIRVDLRYASDKNFLKKNVYGCLKKAYLKKEAALALASAQKRLQQNHKGFRLLVWDAARPLSIQRQMWNSLEMPARERVKYVADPARGSLHNYGIAVDLTIEDEEGRELDMGTPFDFFGDLAAPAMEQAYLKLGKLNAAQIGNRRLLRQEMVRAGFSPLRTEWWHFQYQAIPRGSSRSKIIE